jgi:hypothetical protein
MATSMIPRVALSIALAGLAACSAYDSRYEFEPRPFEVGHALAGSDDRFASVLVSAVGVHKRDVEHGIPASVELKIRVDSSADEAIRLDPGKIQLFAANLEQFPEPVVPDGPLVVEPNGSGTVTAYFPFPDGKIPGRYDLEGVSARWTLDVGERVSTGNATFTRSSGDDGYYPVGVGFGFGVWNYHGGYHHHHGHGKGWSGGGGHHGPVGRAGR